MKLISILQIVFAITIFIDLCIVIGIIGISRLRTTLARLFTALFSTLIFWESMLWMEFFVPTPIRFQLLVDQLAFGSGAGIVLLSIYFVWHISGRSVFSKRSMKILMFFFSIPVALAFIPGVALEGRQYFSEAPYNYAIVAGPFLSLFYLILASAPFILAYILWKAFVKSNQLDRIRIGIIGLGLLIVILLGSMSSVWLQLAEFLLSGNYLISAELSIVVIQVITGITISVFSLCAAYAVGRYRFLGLRLVVKKNVFIFAITILFIVACIFGLSLLAMYSFIFSIVLAILVSIFAGFFVRGKARSILDGIFFFDELDVSRSLSEDASMVVPYKRLHEYLVDLSMEIQSIVNDNNSKIFVLQRQHKRFFTYYPDGGGEGISFLHPAVAHFRELEGEVVMKYKAHPAIRRLMKKYSADRVVPIFSDGDLLALIFLHEKADTSRDTDEDQSALLQIAQTAGGDLLAHVYLYETLVGLKRKLNNDIFEV